MKTTTQYIMRDQVRGLVPTIMSSNPVGRSAGFGILQFAAFLAATATYLAVLALAA